MEVRQRRPKRAKEPITKTKRLKRFSILEKPSAARSRIMRAVHSTDTTPEKRIRSLVHRLGFRFRLHQSSLPGKPDLTFSSRKKVLFVHGCFWHGHRCRRGARVPKTNRCYWLEKIASNRFRDRHAKKSLSRLGWESLVIWECELRDIQATSKRIGKYLGASRRSR
jgi:DNA mismatch endonuclease (patch repair protein)